jgi:hypothetical protein
MAISEVCKYQIKKEMDECVSKGMSRRAAAKWLAGVLSEDSGREINPEALRKMDQRVRKEVGTNVPTEDWPKCKKCRSARVKQGKYVGTGELGDLGGEIMVPAPASHGLCDSCRKEELREQREKKEDWRIKKAQEEFDQTPVDAESDQFWNKLSEKILGPLSNGGIPCDKVSEEVLSRVNSWFAKLIDSIHKVSNNSTRPGKYR